MKLESISFSYDDKVIFDDYSLEVNEGITCIMGASGLGKTTLLKIMAGLLEPDKGRVVDQPVKPAFMFQEDRLLGWLNVHDNLALISKNEDVIRDMLSELEIDPSARISELSGGMARRVALARALLYDGDWLLLDEPFKGMDSELITRAAKLILKENKPAVIATHSLDEVRAVEGMIIEI